MDKCCTLNPPLRHQRRLHGLQLPLNFQQVMGWIVFVTTALINFIVLTQIQVQVLNVVTTIMYAILYVMHAISHISASLIDPSETELRKLAVNNVPEFDRSIHAHVIENGRCHLCNIHTSSKKTKHCSLCNKCVDHFDHHCKWLNNCIGAKNYTAFLMSVLTALLIAILTVCLCATDIIVFFKDPHYLSKSAQHFINCTVSEVTSDYCRTSISFLVFVIIFGFSALAIMCPLLHLCCFHIYISILGVSTYEYMVSSDISDVLRPCYMGRCRCSKFKFTKKLYTISKPKTENVPETEIIKPNHHNGQSVANLISILINNELGRAKKMLIYDKNKIHPHETDNKIEQNM